MVMSRPASTQTLCTASTSSTQTDIQTPLSIESSSTPENVVRFAPLPRPPCAPRHRKISHLPEQTAPKVGGVPQSQAFCHPHLSNHANVAGMSETLRIGVRPLAYMRGRVSQARITGKRLAR